MCTRSRSQTAQRFPGELRQTNAKNVKLAITGPGSTGPAVPGRNQRSFTLNPLMTGHWSPSLVPTAVVIPAPIAARFLNF